jgi:hypothetical protein
VAGKVSKRMAELCLVSQVSVFFVRVVMCGWVLCAGTSWCFDTSGLSTVRWQRVCISSVPCPVILTPYSRSLTVLQAHVAVEGSPVIQKYLDSLATGEVKVSLSGFQRWTLGQ